MPNLVGSETAQVQGHGLTDAFPRASLGFYPTPLEPLHRLSDELGIRLFVKRDDCTGLAMGGNKVRQMEFVFGDALAKGADTVVSTSAVQSNHLRVIAAAASRLGLACEIQREDRVRGMPPEYYCSGNALLQDLLGAKAHVRVGIDDDAAADIALGEIAERVRAEGGNPYVIGVGLENPPLAALGYVEAAGELLDQIASGGLDVDAIVLPSGSAATHAGTLVGLRALGSAIRVFGICVRRDAERQAERVLRRCVEVAEMVGRPGLIEETEVRTSDAFLGPGYGLPTPETLAALKLAARREGLLLDPVYSGKTLAGVMGLVRDGTIGQGATVVFLHTGGTPAIFAYESLLADPSAKRSPADREDGQKERP